jgi:hypothetical protein
MSVPKRSILLTGVVALVVAVAGVLVHVGVGRTTSDPSREPVAARCARGYEPVVDALAEVRAEMRSEGESEEAAGEGESEEAQREEAEREGEHAEEGGSEFERELAREAVREIPVLEGVDPDDYASLCIVARRPESLKELTSLFNTQAMSRLAPYGVYRDGAALNAVRQARALERVSIPAAAGTAARYGVGPLIVDNPAYPEVSGLGLHKNSGRVDSYAYDSANKRLFAAVASGGIWRSDNLGRSWRNATGNLPTAVTGAVTWTSARGGSLIALTGEPTFGSSAYTGLGAYWSADLGRHWKRASGVPAAALGFALAVDPAHPRRVYAATQRGLFVSRDAGRTYRNANLPTGVCKGVTNISRRPNCNFANTVTDVVVVQPGGKNTTTKAGTVLATVGWRGGQKRNRNGVMQSPRNGIYRSTTGAPGSFAKTAVRGFADQDAIGRTEVGQARGRGQDHDLLYALVQDANLLNNGGVGGIDVPEGTSPPLGSTVLNGLYVSKDFGKTWSELASGSQLALDPTTGSALVGTGTATGYQPGVQGWYNLWVQPDPSRATVDGIPTRLAFGLEELWSNDLPQSGQPLDGSTPVKFRVVGKYFGGSSCLLLSAGLPTCPGDREPTDDNSTTHPDQQDGIWISDPSVAGGVQLVVGNDGGTYRYRFESDDDGELDNSHWGPGDQAGYSTLLPYFAAMANDGTVYGGLQDNGNLKIDKTTKRHYEVYGGDGFFSAVDPADSDVTYEEYTNAAISSSTDGGSTWKSIDPGLTASKFSNPFMMDPRDANHLITAGREVVETLVGPSTDSGFTAASDADASTSTWIKVFDLGTRSHPGDAGATSSATDPDNSMSAVATIGNTSYVGFCGHCDTLNKQFPTKAVFKNGLATNVGGKATPQKGKAAGWHIVPAKGLPNRYITSIAIDPSARKRIFVTLGGYTRRWVPPGVTGDTNTRLGTGNLYRSVDGGRSFVKWSGNLPDTTASWVTIRNRQLLVGTDVGAFTSTADSVRRSPRFARMKGLPRTPVSSITLKPNNYNKAVVAQFGRGVWTYTFANKVATPTAGKPSAPVLGTPVASYNFEAGAQGWTTAGTPTWQRGTPGHGSGTQENAAGNAFAITGLLGYVDNMDATLTSPAITLPKGRAVVRFAAKLDVEAFDPVAVEWSAGGSEWKPIGSFSGKNDDHPGWTTYSVLLPSPGGQVKVRFHFTSDSFCSGAPTGTPLLCAESSYDGVHLDDVAVGPAR